MTSFAIDEDGGNMRREVIDDPMPVGTAPVSSLKKCLPVQITNA